jgi:class 3 adenylate cyclase/tetratricopeptide (TPR) repeat protein
VAACGRCSAENGPDNRFCSACGFALSSVCRSCAEPVDAGARFCGACGSAASQPETAKTPVAERRVCSVLFCDLVGFTTYSESRDAEEVRELLSRYFETARGVVLRYGGVVEKFIGDAVMAVWGTPVVREGDTERAVRAALDLVDAIEALGVEVGVPTLRARAGVVTGEVAVTIGAANEGMVAGDAVNTAARVQSAAAPGTVLVDEATRRLAEAAVAFDDGGTHEMKGKALPQQLWMAGRVLAGLGGIQRLDGLETRLVGRDLELRLVRDLFHTSVDRRQPRLVVVSGAAGVGKSRLGWEFEKYVDGLADDVAWHRGRCLSYGHGVAFWALAEVVRQRLGIADEDPAEVAGAKLVAGIEAIVAPEERDYIGVRLGRLLGITYPGNDAIDLSRDELFAGWRLWFERLAALDPVVLLIEDLQYADSGLLAFLDHLVTWAKDAPIFVLGFARPELEHERPGWASGRNRNLVVLDSLDDTSMATLLELLVPGMPRPAAAQISHVAHGIPLFAVETIRSLIDKDIVVPTDGVYRLVGDVGTLTVPASLHELLAARLDALPPLVRGLVGDASVVGSTFPAEALVAVSHLDEQQVHDGLQELVRRGVLEISADPLSPQRGSYHFAHEMLRQVAHNTLSRRDRKALHLAVTVHLRSAFAGDGEEVIDVVARHYLDALTAVPNDPDLSQIRDQALEALNRAGERSLRVGAPGSAANSFITASELVLDRLTSARLAARAADSALSASQFADAIDYARRTNETYLELGDVRAAARARVTEGASLRITGRHTEARTCLHDALEALTPEPDASTVLALEQLADLEIFDGTDAAGPRSDEALVLGQSLAVEPTLLAGLCTVRALYLSNVGRRTEAAALMREAARLAEGVGKTNEQGAALMNLSDIVGAWDPTEAEQAAREAAVLLRRAGDSGYLAFALSNLSAALVALGEWDDAAMAVHETAETDLVDDVDEILGRRAWICALRGDTDGIEPLIARMTVYPSTEAPQEQAGLALTRGLAAAATGHWDEALRLAMSVLQHIDALGIGSEQIRWAWPLASRAAFETGETAATQDLLTILHDQPRGLVPPMVQAEHALVLARVSGQFDEAILELRAGSTPYHLAQGLLDHADHLQRHGSHTDANPLIEEARQIADRLGADAVRRRAESMGNSLVAT